MTKQSQPNNCLSPDSLSIKLLESLKSSQVSFWVDSSGGPKELCKNSFYGVNPKYYIYGSLNEINLCECESGAITFAKENCFSFLEEKIKEEKGNPEGIFVGYFAYDLLQGGEKGDYPDFFFAYFDKCHSCESENLDKMIYEKQGLDSHFHGNDKTNLYITSNMTNSEYLEKVKQIKEEIKAGNVYQVNLTREYSATVKDIDDLELYLRLRSASPNPYGCYFKTPFLSILSSSPEEFIYINSKEKYIRTRPIKGTLTKGEFEIDPKNQAENIMIVDLERNDLGRICEYGTVEAKKLLEVESYKHLNHVVSTVEGKLKSDAGLKKIFEALFPGGSITGAPKISAMKIIEKLEPTRRGAYTGTFGYIKTDGTMDFNILIRTILVQKDKIIFNVGGGIVADSSPESELEETRLKAEGIKDSLALSLI